MQINHNRLITRMVVAVLSAAAITACIGNDTPPPIVKGTIVGIEAEKQIKAAIDPLARTVVIDLRETADPSKVRITKLELSETAVCEIGAGSTIDLSRPLKVSVKTVAEYEWTFSATQTIERRFVIENQVGSTWFEEIPRNAFAYVPKGTDLTKIRVIDLKLGPEGITQTSPQLNGKVVSFRASEHGDTDKVREINVTYNGKTETWSLFVTETDTQLNRVHAFARRVYLMGSGQEGLENGFEYKKTGGGENEEWIRVPENEVEHSGGVFKACLRGLEPETEYAVRAYSGENRSPEETFTTEGTREMPDGDLDQWHKAGKLWNPWPSGGHQWWDTGNQGTTTLGNSNSVPTDPGEGCPLNPEGRAAFLETRFVGIGPAGKVAGGNIYFGRYAETTGTNGKVDIGWSWQHRPTKLKGYYKYTPQKINYVGTLHSHERDRWLGTTDSLNVCVALWASPDGQTRPYQVNSDPKNFVDFTPSTPGIIAFGAFATDKGQSEWTEFTIDIEYRTTNPLPSNTILFFLATSSKSCNYFTAASGSLLYIDELRLEYD